jgi:hypothetical protein
MTDTRNPLVITDRVLSEVLAERIRQDDKWGQQNHRDGTGPDQGVLDGWTASALAEAARNNCQRHAEMGIVSWLDILGEEVAEALAEDDPAKLRAELLQVAAVAVAWIEAIDRRKAADPGDPRGPLSPAQALEQGKPHATPPEPPRARTATPTAPRRTDT